MRADVRVRRDDGAARIVDTFAHHVHAEETLFLFEHLLDSCWHSLGCGAKCRAVHKTVDACLHLAPRRLHLHHIHLPHSPLCRVLRFLLPLPLLLLSLLSFLLSDSIHRRVSGRVHLLDHIQKQNVLLEHISKVNILRRLHQHISDLIRWAETRRRNRQNVQEKHVVRRNTLNRPVLPTLAPTENHCESPVVHRKQLANVLAHNLGGEIPRRHRHLRFPLRLPPRLNPLSLLGEFVLLLLPLSSLFPVLPIVLRLPFSIRLFRLVVDKRVLPVLLPLLSVFLLSFPLLLFPSTLFFLPIHFHNSLGHIKWVVTLRIDTHSTQLICLFVRQRHEENLPHAVFLERTARRLAVQAPVASCS
eukprot:comp22674_c1_seq1/m.35054 comp22674_c1_seq1/g.35054  ORF comp22674_c1_seq1/g.35054 comp22674_c1_seq1/m.35054 type:complete len:359 (+) comp22674_c1_seq1:2811-3887(+)